MPDESPSVSDPCVFVVIGSSAYFDSAPARSERRSYVTGAVARASPLNASMFPDGERCAAKKLPPRYRRVEPSRYVLRFAPPSSAA